MLPIKQAYTYLLSYSPTWPIPIIPILFSLMSVELLRTLIGATRHFMFLFMRQIDRRPTIDLHDIMVDESWEVNDLK